VKGWKGKKVGLEDWIGVRSGEVEKRREERRKCERRRRRKRTKIKKEVVSAGISREKKSRLEG
jgi:hypothetical protein